MVNPELLPSSSAFYLGGKMEAMNNRSGRAYLDRFARSVRLRTQTAIAMAQGLRSSKQIQFAFQNRCAVGANTSNTPKLRQPCVR
jgi:hypothetical protein